MAELELIYLETRPANIAYIKFIFESYEEVGIVRTVDRKRAVIVLLAMRDFVDTARAILESIQREIPLQEILPLGHMPDDWFMCEFADKLAGERQAD